MARDAPLALGLAVPVFASPGIPTMRTPSFERLGWEPVRAAVVLAEELGYDSAWVSDHLFHGRDGDFYECWTTISALAGCTDRLRLVTNHLNHNFRHAPLVAKMAATLDVISGGRFELFLSPGMREREHVSYGFGWEPDEEIRTRKLGEAVTLIRSLWSGQPVDAAGSFYQLNGAISAPRPLQPKGPPIWIGGVLHPGTLRLVADQADGWNCFPASPDALAEKLALVRAACVEAGRDPDTLRVSLETQVLVLDHPADWERWLDTWEDLHRRIPLGDATSDLVGESADHRAEAEAQRDSFIIGTRAEVRERLMAYHELGVDEVVCWFMDFPSSNSMQTLATTIRPTLH